MGKVETIFYVEPAERPCDLAVEWILVTSACLWSEITMEGSTMIKKLVLAACSAAALMSFACASASAYPSRKTGFSEFHEFDDLTGERNSMFDPCTVFSGSNRCVPVSQAITSNPLGNNCYVGGFSLDTAQLTVPSTNTNEVQLGNHNSLNTNDSVIRATPQLTVHSATTSEVQLQTRINSSEFVNSTSGTYEGTHQLKARLA